MSSRPGFHAVAAVALVSVIAVLPARAGISGPCAATIAGESVADRSTSATGSPIVVDRHSQVPVAMSAKAPISHLKVLLSFGGFSWAVHDQPTTGTSWAKSVDVDKYAKYGVGLYRVSGASTGSGLNCTGAALVKVKGNPLTTVAGGVGLGLLVLSGVGLLLVGLKGEGPAAIAGGILLGLVGGLAVGVLLQQFSVLYPTRQVAIIELVAGAALGLSVFGLHKLVAHKPATVRSANG
jgi:hypothetical protein